MTDDFSQPQIQHGAPTRNIGIEYSREGGLITYWDGRRPRKGYFPDQRIMDRLEACKSLIMFLAKIVIISPLKYFLIFPKLRAEIIRSLASVLHKTLHRYYLTDDMWCAPVRELNKIVLQNIPPLYDMAFQRLKNVFLSFVEYDEAYRYRLQDILGELSPIDLKKNPKKEFLRLLEIGEARDEDTSVQAKWRLLQRIIRWIPEKYLRKLAESMEELNWDALKLDESDYDWAKYKAYRFLGRSVKI